MAPQTLHSYRFAEYLALEEASNTKHEFFSGEIYGLAGGTPEHAALAVSVSAALLTQLRGGPCRVFSSDLRVRVLATGLATYPDVTVVCGPLEYDPASPTTVTNPKIVVEVLSDATENYDRGEKLAQYRLIPTLAAVVFVFHRVPKIEICERATEPSWTRSSATSGETAHLASIPISLVVDEIYRAGG
jgi:Uma2 family endonuclease